jgi:hypothetical protein
VSAVKSALALAAILGASACTGAPQAGARMPGPFVNPKRLDGAAWLAPDAARARAVGAGPLEVVAADVASEGDRVGGFIQLGAGDCALVITRSSPQVVDVDLFAYEEDGGTFASDEGPDPQAAIVVCTKTARRLYVAARVAAGGGIVAVGVLPIPKGGEGAVRAVFGPRGRDDDGPPGFEARARAHRAALGGRWEEIRRFNVPLDSRAPTRASTVVEANRCLDVFLAASDDVLAFDLDLQDENGRTLAVSRVAGRDRAVVVCAEKQTNVDLALRARGSQGTGTLSYARSPRGTESEITDARVVRLAPPKDLAAARAAQDVALRAAGYGPGRQIALGVARGGVRTSTAVDLPPGCARVDVVVGRPFTELAAALWDEKGNMLADARAATSAPLFTCGKGGPARVDLEPLETPGPYAVELRSERVSPPLLVAHPIAAARLLGRVAASGNAATTAALADARAVSLDPSTLKTLPLAIGAKACVDVFAALDAGASGLDLRLVEARARDGETARARFVTSNRLCAGVGGAQATIELRVDAGRADALVWSRPVVDAR